VDDIASWTTSHRGRHRIVDGIASWMASHRGRHRIVDGIADAVRRYAIVTVDGIADMAATSRHYGAVRHRRRRV
jgi:fatty-acid desaturase